jgi:hypothetical protein
VAFVVDKPALWQVFSRTSVYPANHSTDFSTLIIIHHPGPVALHPKKGINRLTLISAAKFLFAAPV